MSSPDTAGRERRAAARIDWQSMSAIDLLDAYMVALGTAIRRPASMIERSDEIRMELLRRLNAKDAASAAAGSKPGSVVLDFGIAEQIRACLSYYVSLRRDDAHLLLGHLDSALIAAESAEASGEKRES